LKIGIIGQNKFIELILNKLESQIVSNIKTTLFFSIIINSIKNISEVDQSSKINYNCVIENDKNRKLKNIRIKQIFLGFHKVENQSNFSISTQVLQNIERKDYKNKCC